MSSLLLLASDIGPRNAWRVGLEARGFDVIIATTAPAAVERLREGGVDLLLVDYDVDGGIGALLAGLARLPDAPPLVLISGAVDAPAISARLGAAAFLPKPCLPDELVKVVSRVAVA